MIRFNQVSKTFRRTRVLDSVDLEIGQGDRVALVGSNGAGKTTLIRCLLGEYICDGEVLLAGKEVRRHRTEILKRVGFVPQIPPPLKMPVQQLIHFAAGVCDSDPTAMYRVAEKLGLDASAFRKHPFVKLSGGQKQKLLIAIALGRDCDVLVMDEPAANLDPEARHALFDLLAQKQDDAAMIISSHRLDEVAALVNRVIELDRGKVVLDDHVADTVDMNSILACRISLTRPDSAFAETVREWGFAEEQGGLVWSGPVAGPDRLRFLGVLSRYAGLLNGIDMRESVERKVAGGGNA
ncbi:MAG TPA: ABC transporter ATP-binding protein [Gammaproteobacteria bacterium]|nr:ABC transporter ATP-binding protein [Gammaproteobacteria bacterium]